MRVVPARAPNGRARGSEELAVSEDGPETPRREPQADAHAPEAGQPPAWEIVLPEEGATEDLGRFLAELLVPGDLVALSGGLGGGKTTLARALIRELAGAPDLDVPSPN